MAKVARVIPGVPSAPHDPFAAMIRGAVRALRFWRSWARSGAGARAQEIEFARGSETIPATLYLPSGRSERLPGWVLLHGITVPGRRHEVLVRFARALAASGSAVLTPEIPEWTDLRLEPELSVATIRAAVVALSDQNATRPDRIGLVGFSFGAPQAIIASTDPSLDGRLRLVVGFGGYCDLRRLLRFMFTGRHEWQGEALYRRPDPYGRWVVGANYLTKVAAYATFSETTDALRHLAREAGLRRLASWDPTYDPMKVQMRDALPEEQRPIFDLFAPTSDEEPDPEAAHALVDQLLEAMHGASDLLEPARFLEQVDVPVRLFHGIGDHLIPYSESLRLEESFPEGADVRVALTGFFSHSGTEEGGLWTAMRQATGLGAELARVFEAV